MKGWLHISLIYILLTCGCNKTYKIDNQISPSAEIKLHAPNGTVVGNDIYLMVKTGDETPRKVKLTIDNGLTFNSLAIKTNQRIIIAGEDLKQAGLTKLIVSDGSQVICKRKLLLQPADIIDPLEITTGPRSIIVGGKQTSMTVAIPSDVYNNGITSFKPINYNRNKQVKRERVIEHLLAWDTIKSDPIAKKLLLGVSEGTSASEEQHIIQTPDHPTGFTIELLEFHGYSDNRHYSKIRTSEIKDQFGNQIADGTIVSFLIKEGPNFVGQYNSIVIDGSSTVFIRNPKRASTWSVQAKINSAQSNSLKLEFKRNIKELTYTHDSFLKRISVGPLKGVLGQHVPDGTLIEVIIAEKVTFYYTYKGMATIDLMELQVESGDLVKLKVENLIEQIQI